ncbi:hypothetical protein BC831DRAFT_509012 [Entophlyctis helioformis]|nr:hypothetical protein BC831DRAFT_509012 [Entophlyctis helioformis]
MAANANSSSNDQEMNDGMAEIELQKLQRQYRIMEGDRKAYSEESRILIGKQRATIDKLKKDNEHLQDELRLLEQRNEDRRKNGIQSKKAETMAEQAGMSLPRRPASASWLGGTHADKCRRIRQIMTQIGELDGDTAHMDAEVDIQRAKLGGVNAARQNHEAIDKQVRVLENRLDKALVKFNKALAVNKRLRAIIDNLRRERLVFDNIYHKFERELMEQKKQMAEIIEMSNAAYEARDEAQTKIIALREKAEKEYQSYIQEIKELDRTLEQDRKLKEFMATKMLDRSERADGIQDGDKKGKSVLSARDKDNLGGNKFPSQESLTVSLETYENAFSEIRKVTGISDIGELVQRFKTLEDQNFSLFNYVNEINNEIEMHAEEIVEIQRRIDGMRVEAVAVEEDRKKTMRALEDELNTTNEKAQQYEKQYGDVTLIMGDLRNGIENLIAAFQAAAKLRPASSSSSAGGGSGGAGTQTPARAGGEGAASAQSAAADKAAADKAAAVAAAAVQSASVTSLHTDDANAGDGDASSQAPPSDTDGQQLLDAADSGLAGDASASDADPGSQPADDTGGAMQQDGASATTASASHLAASATQQTMGSGQPAHPSSASPHLHPSSASSPPPKKADRLRAHFEFALPSEGISSHGVTEANLLQFLGLIEQKSNELLTLNYLVNAPRKTVVPAAAGGSGGAGGVGGSGGEGGDGLVPAGGVAGLLGQGPIAPIGTLTIVAQAPGEDDHDSSGNLSDEDDRPLTREELKQKTLRGLNKREKTATGGHKTQAAKSKRKPLLPVLKHRSTAGIPFTPLAIETAGLAIVVAFHARVGNPLTTWGEAVPMLIADLLMVAVHLAARQRRRHLLHPAHPAHATTAMPTTAIAFLVLAAATVAALLNPRLVSHTAMTLLLTLTFPMFLGSSLLQVWINASAGHIGRLSPLMLVCGFACGWGRALTAAVEIDDTFVQTQALVGAVVGTVLVCQMVAYRERTRLYLIALDKAEDSAAGKAKHA